MPRANLPICVLLTALFLAGAALGQDVAALRLQLQREADALVDDAVVRPYGLALSAVSARHLGNAPAVDADTRSNAAAVVVLIHIGEVLDKPRYQKTAFDIWRTLVSAMESNGRIGAHLRLGPTSAGSLPDPPGAMPDRSGATSAVGALAAIMRTKTREDSPQLHTGAFRAVVWLIKQQARNVAWLWQDESTDARIINLAATDYRDAVLALLLADGIFQHPAVDNPLRLSRDILLSLRLQSVDRNRRLWADRYNAGGQPLPLNQAPLQDMVATRLTLQTLFTFAMMRADRECALVLDPSRRLLEAMREPGETLWHRHYSLLGRAVPTTRPVDSGSAATALDRGAFGLPAVIKSCIDLQALGRQRYLALLPPQLQPDQQVSLVLTGLEDDLLTLDWPVSRDEVPAAIGARALRWKLIEGQPPEDLPGRIRRLWALVLRLRLQQLVEAS